jgi:hypothetical protein
LVGEWVTGTKLPFHPQVAEEGSILDKIFNSRKVIDALGSGIAEFVPPKNPDLIGTHGI